MKITESKGMVVLGVCLFTPMAVFVIELLRQLIAAHIR